MKICEIKAKSIIAKSNLPATDYVINPYVGCNHACIYCYARFMKRFTGHTENWGEFVDVKINAAELIPVQIPSPYEGEGKGEVYCQNLNTSPHPLLRKERGTVHENSKYKNKSIFLSSVTDPYLSLERKYQLTRKVLEKLIPLQPDLGMQTKSDLIVRDIDLLKQFKSCEVGMTMTTLDDKIRQEIEPFTSSPERRIAALKELKKAGLKTYVFVGPILPFLTDWQKIILATKDFVDLYMFENLSVRGSIWTSIEKWLKDKHPELEREYERIYFSKNDYWQKVEAEIRKFCQKERIDGKIFFHHGK